MGRANVILLLAASCSMDIDEPHPFRPEVNVNGLLVGAPSLIVPQKKLVVIFGYSNDLGRGTAADVTNYAGITGTVPAVQIMERCAGSQANPPTMVNIGPRDLGPRTVSYGGGGYAVGGFGIELTMGHELSKATPDTWYIAKHGMDGAAMHAHYNNPAFPASGFGGLSFRQDLLAFVDNAIATFGITNTEENVYFVTIEGLIDDGTTLQAEFAEFFGVTRARYGNHRIVMERLHAKLNPDRDQISAIEQFAFTDARTKFVYVDDLPTISDIDLHYTSNSYATHGVRDAEAIIELTRPRAPGLRIKPRYVDSGRIVGADSAHGMTPYVPLHVAGQVLVFFVVGGAPGAYSLSTPNGYVDVPGGQIAPNAYPTKFVSVQAWWVRADAATMLANGGQMPAPVMSDLGGDDYKFGWISVFDDILGVGDPFDVHASDSIAASSAVSMPEVTTDLDNTLIVHLMGFNRDAFGQSIDGVWRSTQLADVIKQFDYTNGASVGYGIGLVTAIQPLAGPTGNTFATLVAASSQTRLTFALKPRVP